LIQRGAEAKGLEAAISLFYWEVTDLLLQQYDPAEAKQIFTSMGYCFARPFHHWIAHGKDHQRSISRTFDVLERHNLWFNEDFSVCQRIAPLLRTDDDFEIIRQLASRGADIKFKDEEGDNALRLAIQRSKRNEAWPEILDFIISFYTVAELESESAMIFADSYLHFAVSHGSVVGAAALLRKGVNVNQITDENLGETPFQLCARMDGSTGMMALLLGRGASMEPSDGILPFSPLENRLIGLQRTTKVRDLLLEQHPAKSMCARLLHLILQFAMAERGNARSDAVEAFRHLLASDSVRAYVNEVASPDDDRTLLYKVSAAMKPYFVQCWQYRHPITRYCHRHRHPLSYRASSSSEGIVSRAPMKCIGYIPIRK
jgi:hypothetical protein